jgi:hypothetical protein
MHGNNASRQSARMGAHNIASGGGAFGHLEGLSGYRRPWRKRKHYNAKDKTLRTHRTGR